MRMPVTVVVMMRLPAVANVGATAKGFSTEQIAPWRRPPERKRRGSLPDLGHIVPQPGQGVYC